MIDLLTGSGHSVEPNWQPSAREDSILYIDNAASVSRTQISTRLPPTVLGQLCTPYTYIVLVLELQIEQALRRCIMNPLLFVIHVLYTQASSWHSSGDCSLHLIVIKS